MIPIVKTFFPPRDLLMPELEEVLYSGYVAQGEQVERFEKQLANYFGNDLLLTLNSGTAALHLALILCGVSDGDEVISTPMTAEPTNISIAMTGARVVWADVEETTGLISVDSVIENITPKTKAIMVVHYAGRVADLNRLREVAQSNNIPIIEDCAHAFAASYKGKPIGYYSDFAIFSFQAIKHITTIDGGLLILKNKSHYERAKKLRWFGLDKDISRADNNITEPGYKYHMNDVAATIGLCQLKHLDENTDHYIKNGEYFDNNIKNERISIPKNHSDTRASYWLYTILTDEPSRLNRFLEAHGIMASQLHKRNDLHSVFPDGKDLTGLERFCKRFTHFGCGNWITSEREKIIDILNSYK